MKKIMWKKILVQDTLERVVCIFLVGKFRIPKTLYLSDGEAENIQWYLKLTNTIVGGLSIHLKFWLS